MTEGITVIPHEHSWSDPLETPYGVLLQCGGCVMLIFEDDLEQE